MKYFVLFGLALVFLMVTVHCEDLAIDEDDRELDEDDSEVDEADLKSWPFMKEVAASLRKAECSRPVVNNEKTCTVPCAADRTCSNGGICCSKSQITIKKKPNGKTCKESNDDCSKYVPSSGLLRIINVVLPPAQTTKKPKAAQNKKCMCSKTTYCCTPGSATTTAAGATTTAAGATTTAAGATTTAAGATTTAAGATTTAAGATTTAAGATTTAAG